MPCTQRQTQRWQTHQQACRLLKGSANSGPAHLLASLSTAACRGCRLSCCLPSPCSRRPSSASVRCSTAAGQQVSDLAAHVLAPVVGSHARLPIDQPARSGYGTASRWMPHQLKLPQADPGRGDLGSAAACLVIQHAGQGCLLLATGLSCACRRATSAIDDTCMPGLPVADVGC